MTLKPFVTLIAKLLLICSIQVGTSAQITSSDLTSFPPHVEKYISDYHSIAIEEMHRSGVPASIILGQGMLESFYGKSRLTRFAKNHFGIKCHENWTGETFYHESNEFVNGKMIVISSCFRKYDNAKHSFEDHTDYLMNRNIYTSLFESKNTTYLYWAKGLQEKGYATDPNYSKKLIGMIEKYDLHLYDNYQLNEVLVQQNKPLNIIDNKINNLEDKLLYAQQTKVKLETIYQRHVQNNDDEHLSDLKAGLEMLQLSIERLQSDIESVRSQVRHIQQVDMLIVDGRRATKTKDGFNLVEIAKVMDIKIEDLLAINQLEEEIFLPNDYLIYLEKEEESFFKHDKNNVRNHFFKAEEPIKIPIKKEINSSINQDFASTNSH